MSNRVGSILSSFVLVACADPVSSLDESAPASNQSAANLDQCANGPLAAPVACTGAAWVNGNLNPNQAHYIEGESVPYRLRLSGLAINTNHVVRIEWDTTEQGRHALDYLTSWNRSEFGEPCTGVEGCSATVPTHFAMPVDANVARGPDGIAGTADDIAQAAGAFALHGGTLTGVSSYSVNGTYTGTSQTSVTITFTANVSNPVLAWGGHISLRTDWRPQPTAADISGSPYHMRLLDLDGPGGNQDRSLSAAAVYNLPNLIVIKHVINDNGGTAVPGDFKLAVTGPTPSPATFPGAEAPGTLVTFGNEGDYSVTEETLERYVASYSADCTGTIAYDETKTCTVTNDDRDLCFNVTCDGETACGEAGVCNPADGKCTYAPKPSTTVCRASAGGCDVAETCTGTDTVCPPDGFADPTTMCRAPGGACDVAEYCTGSSATCPDDAKSVATCRTSAGMCDVAEVCDGVSNDCPGDSFVASTVTCRESSGVCDVAEQCTGAGPACPPDGFQVGTVCRESAGACDVAEVCSGGSAACPADQFQPTTFTCRDSTGVCDVAESCSGNSAACPPDGFADVGTECRASAGDCDVAEHCTGFSGSCPSDAVLPATEICRAADGVCDVAESCTGLTATCPGNGFSPSTTECRSSAGVCDVTEMCPGFAAACPDDAFLPSTEMCRTSAGDCDVAEACTGVSALCPDDRLVAVGTACRASKDGCDPAEVCTGVTAGCPTDVAGTCTLCGEKFYDVNANGSYDPDELGIAGWQFELTAAGTTYATTDAGGGYAFSNLPAGDYTLCESSPLESNWMQTAPATRCVTVAVPSALAESCTIDFGNLCLGWGGGHTIGYWASPNGKTSFLGTDGGASSLALITSLNLVNGSGSAYDPTTYQQFATWLTNASATNMAYMLSAQLAAMELNVKTEIVDGADLVYAPGTTSANSLGFATIDDLMAEANAELGLHATTFDGSPFRAYQEALKNGLNGANNNLNFVQPAACTRTFATQ
jgi:hypothetical protein